MMFVGQLIMHLLTPKSNLISRYKGFYNPERDVNLVECEGCKKWFHPSCKKISKNT